MILFLVIYLETKLSVRLQNIQSFIQSALNFLLSENCFYISLSVYGGERWKSWIREGREREGGSCAEGEGRRNEETLVAWWHCTARNSKVFEKNTEKTSRIRETSNLSTDADSSTETCFPAAATKGAGNHFVKITV